MKTVFMLAAFAVLFYLHPALAQPIDIGSRLELLVDDYLIDHMNGDVRLELHYAFRRRPRPHRAVERWQEPGEPRGPARAAAFRHAGCGPVCVSVQSEKRGLTRFFRQFEKSVSVPAFRGLA